MKTYAEIINDIELLVLKLESGVRRLKTIVEFVRNDIHLSEYEKLAKVLMTLREIAIDLTFPSGTIRGWLDQEREGKNGLNNKNKMVRSAVAVQDSVVSVNGAKARK
jgi:hypothetical protein